MSGSGRWYWTLCDGRTEKSAWAQGPMGCRTRDSYRECDETVGSSSRCTNRIYTASSSVTLDPCQRRLLGAVPTAARVNDIERRAASPCLRVRKAEGGWRRADGGGRKCEGGGPLLRCPPPSALRPPPSAFRPP